MLREWCGLYVRYNVAEKAIYLANNIKGEHTFVFNGLPPPVLLIVRQKVYYGIDDIDKRVPGQYRAGKAC
jgi:hypothetical protein